MNENTDSRVLQTELIFTLQVRIPDQSPTKTEVVDRLLVGIDPRNDLILVDPKISAKHFLFRKRNNLLTLHYLGKDRETFLNGLPLEKGKIYLLEKADKIKVGSIEIIVRRESAITQVNSPQKTPSKDFLDSDNNDDEQIKNSELHSNSPVFQPAAPTKLKLKATKKEKFFNFETINLIPFKFYGFCVDVALTYWQKNICIQSQVLFFNF